MKKLMIVLALTLVVTAGCSNQKTEQENSLIDSNSTQVEESAEQGTENENEAVETENTGEESKEADKEEAIIPKAELDAALSLKNAIDIKASEAEVEEITLEPESESWDPRVIKQYTQKGQILKLSVTEPTDAGKMTGLTTFYYDQGELFFIESDFANYVFKNGKLIVWSDENYNILDMTNKDLETRQEVLVNYLVDYLEMFSIGNK